MSRFPLPAALLALGMSAAAPAQYRDNAPDMGYRDGQPEVMARPMAPPSPGAMAASRFSSAYARARSPRIVIFWNREFSDEVSSDYQDYVSGDSHSEGTVRTSTDVAGGRRWAAGTTETNSSTDSSFEVRGGTRRIRPEGGRMLNGSTDFDVKQGFTSALGGAGARLVDLNAIMRTTGVAKGAGERANVQALETQALMANADIVIEVMQMGSSDGPLGVDFRVIVRSLRGARQLASFRSDGAPPVQRMGYVAGANGFERARPPAPTPSGVGRQLASQVMSALANSL